MLTIAALPKPFIGHVGIIQRNAIQSWLNLRPRPQIILFGDEEGVAEVALEYGIEHVPDVDRNAYGTPLLSSVFSKAEAKATSDIICYANCDIFLFQDYVTALERVQKMCASFLLLAECVNLDVRECINFSSTVWEEDLRRMMKEKGKRRISAADFFTFRKNTFPSWPALTLGRAYFDNWIIYESCRLGIPVIDATGQITAIHQNHFYTVVPGETLGNHGGNESGDNFRILGGWDHLYWLYDASHKLTAHGIRRSLTGSLHVYQRWLRFRRGFRRSLVRLAAMIGLREKPYYAR